MKRAILIFIGLCLTTLLQAQVSKTANVTAGNLSTVLTATEQSTVTNLTLTGTIDARDFKIMRDNMPVLAVIDLGGVSVAAYTGTGGTAGSGSITYPANGIPDMAFSIDDWIGQTRITSIAIPGSITSIGAKAFADCKGLTAMIIPPLVTNIGQEAFRNGASFKTIIIPSSVNYLLNAFLNFAGLIQVDANNPNYCSVDGVLFTKDKTTLILCPTTKKGSYTIPSSVVKIDWCAFSSCSQLTSIQIPSSVQSIFYYAFSSCNSLTSLNIPSSVTMIKENAFDWCNNLTTITVGWSAPLNLNTSPNVFRGVNKTSCTLYVPAGTKTAYQAANQWMDFSSIVERNYKTVTVTAGNLSTVLTATELSNVTNLTLTGTIDARDFKIMRDNMPLLADIDMSGTTVAAYIGALGTSYWGNNNYPANTIPEAAFWKNNAQGNTTLSSAIMPGSITSIGQFAFDSCTGLTAFSIPSSVISINYSAFNNCRGITAFAIPPSVTSIGDRAFGYCRAAFSVDAANPYYSSMDEVLFNKVKTKLIQFPNVKTGNYTIPSTVTSIGVSAFAGCYLLTSINIPSSVQSIEDFAFNQCSGLTSISLPASVATIKEGIFADCNGLSSITVNRLVPVNLSAYQSVFSNVNKSTCKLNVPSGSSALYTAASRWQDFTNIVEMAEFKLSATSATIAATGGTASADLTTALPWTAASDQPWLTLNSLTGTGNKSFTFTATANSSLSPRFATVTFSTTNLTSQTFVITQAGSPKSVNITAGGLATALTATELSTISKLVLTGTINARDFKTMRDNMPLLAEIDLSGVSISAYTGNEGPSMWGNNNYAANAIPEFAFSIGDWTGQTRLTSIILPGSITSIGQLAFADCKGLTSMIIPSLVTTIGSEAFRYGTSFTSIIIPPSVTNLDGAFKRFAGLINVDPNNPNYSSVDGILFNKTKTSLLLYPTSKTGGYTIPSSVVSIQGIAFEDCSKLTSIQIPSSVQTISWYAISACTSLTSLTIPSSVKTIQNNAFAWSRGLTSISVGWSTPLDLSSSPDVFLDINKSTCTLYVPNGTANLYRNANQWKDFANIVEMAEFKLSATSANIPAAGGTASIDLTTALSWYAKSDQTWLTINSLSGTGNKSLIFTATANSSLSNRIATVTISAANGALQTIVITQAGAPKSLAVTAGGLATALTALELGTANNLVLTGTIDARDFKTMRDNMPLLAILDLSGVTVAAYTGTEGTYPASMGSYGYPANAIPFYAFSNSVSHLGKTSLTTVILPLSITFIGNNSFEFCTGLTSITIPSSVNRIDYNAFNFCSSLITVSIPSSVTSITRAFNYSSGIITVDAANPNYSSMDGVLFDKQKTTLIQCPISKTGTYTIPSSVSTIEICAMAGCNHLNQVNIPSSVRKIELNAFFQCRGLTSITIPSSVSSIGTAAFQDCTGLTSIFSNIATPLNLSEYPNVFLNINKTNCTLNVPYGTKTLYSAANQWQDFTNIVEMSEFKLSANSGTVPSTGGSLDINLTTGLSWTASSDQTWLTLNSLSGTGNQTMTFTATANSSLSNHIATVTVSSAGLPSQTIIITQAGATKTLNVTPGGLSSALSPAELSTATNLVLTGTIDARDFKTMRDIMPMLSQIDISGVTISAYTGTEGTNGSGNVAYPANTVPDYAFYNWASGTAKISLTSIVFPSSITAIGNYVFRFCSGLTSFLIPSSVTSIGFNAFEGCRLLTLVNIPSSVTSIYNAAFSGAAGTITVDLNNPNYSSLNGVLFNREQTTLIQCLTSKNGTYYIPSSVTSVGHGAFSNCNGLTSVIIPSSVTSIANYAFQFCNGLTSIYSYTATPIDLNSSPNVFFNINKNNCTLNVPNGTKVLYAAANQWKDFTNIVEMAEFKLSATSAKIPATGGTASVDLTTGLSWNANSDQSWLTINSLSGTGNNTFTFTATAHSSFSNRTATVTISVPNIPSQTFVITQTGLPKTVNITAGGLASALTATELSTLTRLVLTGTIDARDFKTMRDNMPLLLVLDLSGATIVAYSGPDGTSFRGNNNYAANTIPEAAFYNNNGPGNTTLISVALPPSTTSIGQFAFNNCKGLNSLTIPSSVVTIDYNAFFYCSSLKSINIPASVTLINDRAFEYCSSLITVDAANPNYLSTDGVLFDKIKTKLIQFPTSKAGTYTIPSSVVTIGVGAFSGCNLLTTVNIPSSVQTIDYDAFNQSPGLTSMNIPSSVTSIKSNSFASCSGLSAITVNRSVPVDLSAYQNVFLNVNKSSCTLYVPNGTRELYATSNQWKDFTNIVEMAEFKLSATAANIPAAGGTASVDLTTALSWYAKSDQTWLTINSLSGTGNKSLIFTATANSSLSNRIATVTISASNGALQTIVITQAGAPKTLAVTAGGLATALTALELGTTTNLVLTGTIDARDFVTMRDNMPLLTSIDISATTVVAYTGTAGTAGISSISYAANTIPDYAMYNTVTGISKTNLTTILFPYSVTTIGLGAFESCTGLTSANIGSSVTWIGNYAFDYCTGLTSLQLGSSVAYIGNGSFYNCTGLTSLIIPSSVTYIGGNAFALCSGLTSINIPTQLSTISTNAFYRCGGSFIVEAGNPNYSSLDGALFNKLKTILIQCPVSKTGSYTIPSTVNTLNGNAFGYCANLTAVTIPTSVTSIGSNTFSFCSGLTSLNIPASVTSIGTNAFSSCTGLTSVVIPSSVTTIYGNTFTNCTSLTSVSIPATVTSIQVQAFNNCSSLSKIVALATTPVNLTNSGGVFNNVNKTTCTLFVPYGSKAAYQAANQWKDFANITELDFSLSATKFNAPAEGASANVTITSAVAWTVSSDQSWLTYSPASGTGNNTLVLTAAANTTTTIRTGYFTISSAGLNPQTITIIQGGAPKTLNITAGGLSTALSSEEKNSITTLTLTGTIDARDFRIMRDGMPQLMVIDISGATIASYSGNDGPADVVNYDYPANAIPDFAFFVPYTSAGKTKLISFLPPSSLTAIGQRAFSFCNVASFNLTPSIISIGAQAFCGSSTLISVDAGNPNYSALDGVLYDKNKTSLIHCPTVKAGSFVIPSSVQSIQSRAFYSCGRLTSITIPASITSIGDYEFYMCYSLQSVDIPATVTSIGKYAFYSCISLTSVTIPSGITTINDYCFYSCNSLTTFNIPSSVTSIGVRAFQSCVGLTTINIPSSVTSIAGWSFYFCTGLTSIKTFNTIPVNLNASPTVFYNVNKATCTLYVPIGTTSLYRAANQWQDFTNIVEIPGMKLSSKSTNIASAAGSTATAELTSNVTWNASSDQTWLTVDATSGTGNKTFTFTATSNTTANSRMATVTVSTTDLPSQTIQIIQNGTNGTLVVVAGGLASALTSNELNTVTSLKLAGTIDARDFKTMRDNMPLLASVDLSGTTIVAYTGTEGTRGTASLDYPANTIPQRAFYNTTTMTGKPALTSFVFPASVVTVDRYAFRACGLSSITIPSSVITLEYGNFYYCTNLKTVTFESPSSLTNIGVYAFGFCTQLTSITLPASVASIGVVAFLGSGASVAVDPGNSSFTSSEGVLIDKNMGRLMYCPATKTGSYTVPSSVTTIATDAFYNCSGLQSISIPSSVNTLEDWAFENCFGLSVITIPASVNAIYGYAFYNCRNLKAIYANAVTPVNLSLSDSVFNYIDKNLCTLYVPSGAKSAYQAAAKWKDFTKIVEQNSKIVNVTAGGLYAALTTLELSTITTLKVNGTIDARDFKTMRDNMPLLAELDLSGVTVVAYIGPDGTSIWSDNYPANAVPESAFMNAAVSPWIGKTSLISILLPPALTSIGQNAFYACNGLYTMTIPNQVTTIGDDSFSYSKGLNTINIPASVALIGDRAFMQCTGYINIDAGNPNYSSLDGVLYNKTKTKLIQCPVSKTGVFTIPSTVTTIGTYGLYLCNNVAVINIPASVTTLESNALSYCSGLFNVDAGNPNFSSLDGILFNKMKTMLILSPLSKTGSYTIPSSVLTIGSYAFASCNGYTSITIPTSVTSIGSYTFSDCTGLTSIIAMGSVPLNLNSTPNVFYNVNKNNCTLYVPYGARVMYNSASQWKDFLTIIEAGAGFSVDKSVVNLATADGSSATVGVTANVAWTAIPDQPWLTVSPASGNNNQTLSLTATGNSSVATRIASVVVSATNYAPQTIVVYQSGALKTINVTAGNLASALTAEELNSVSRLAITGTIDARDFKTMRDNMPLLASLDISAATVVAYTGTEGTAGTTSTTYPANGIPDNAFFYSLTGLGKVSLTSVILPNSMISVGISSFRGCNGLTSMVLPPLTISIGNTAFLSCGGLTSITIPQSVTTLGVQAISRCTNLASVNISAFVTSIGGNAFLGSGAAISVNENNPNYSSLDGVLYNKVKSTLIACPVSKTGSFTIPSSVTTISSYAFYNCSSLNSVTIPNTVTSIGNYAFYFCINLTSVTIPTSINSIGTYAFYYCTGLTTITIPASVTSIGNYAFGVCTNLTSIFAYPGTPVNLSSMVGVFSSVNKTSCILKVPYGKVALYRAANQWQDFTNIVEMPNTTAVVKKTSTAPVIDGTIDAVWENANTYNISVPHGTPTLGAPGTTTWKALWTNDGIYILLQVNDDVFYPAFAATPPGDDWMYDKPEIYFDVNQVLKDANGPVNGNGHYSFAPSFIASQINQGAFTNWDGCTYAFKVANPSYVAEYFIPFNRLLDRDGIIVPKIATMGFDVKILDRDNEATNRWAAAWTDDGTTGGAWMTMDGCGTITLEGADAGTLVTGITVNSAGNATTIETAGGTLQMSASILPVNATIPNVQWSVTNGTGKATIDSNGLLSAYSNGTVTVNAKSTDGSYITATKLITLSNQPITPPDAASIVYSIIGNAFYKSDGVTLASWDLDIDLAFIGTANDVSSYKINKLGLIQNGEFKIRKNHQWNESYGYTNVSITGDPTNFAAIGLNSNIQTIAGKTYEIIFKVDWKTNTYSLEMNIIVPAVTTTNASSITANSASSGGEVTNQSNSPVTARGVCWSTAANPTIALTTKTTDGSGNGVFVSSITGLTAGTTYHVRAYATNSLGTFYGTDVIFTTLSTNHFTPVWSGNGVDHMNINIYLAKIDGVELEAGDEVGIFDGTLCVGVGKLTSPISNTSTLDIAVSKNDGAGNGYTAGNTITYKLYDTSKDLEMTNVAAVYASENPSWSTDGKFTIGATAFAALTGVTKVNQDIVMNTGWNIVSTYAIPANLDMMAIFQPLITAGSLKKVMDEAGKTIENFGAFGGWKNNIGSLNSSKGYKVNLTAAGTLSLTGLPVQLPYAISLAAGWNIISYPCSTAQDAKALVQALIGSDQLKKVMDEAGKTIENFGAFGGWKNNIGNFLPGKGYKVNVLSACTLTITGPANKAAVIVPEVLASDHFAKVYTGNGTDHFNVHLVDLASSGLVAGDQIGIFDGNYCVGAATIGHDQLMSGNISIPSSFNDELNGKVNGFTVGHPVTLQLYRDNQAYPLTPSIITGSQAFEKNGSLFVKVVASDLPVAKISVGADQVKCYPNPFVDQLTIEIRLTQPKNLEVKIYDLSGKLVRSLFKGEAGTSETLIWDGTNGNGARMISGTYILKANEMIEKVALKK